MCLAVCPDMCRSEDEANDLRRTPDSVEEEEHVATKPTPVHSRHEHRDHIQCIIQSLEDSQPPGVRSPWF
jgi:hypothetical protein